MNIQHAYILYIDKPDPIHYMEECKASCDQYGIPVTPFLGMKLPTTTAEVKEKWGFRVDPKVDQFYDEPIHNVWFREQLCTTGHLAMWKDAVEKYPNAAIAFMEHDALVKRNFLDIGVQDNEIVFLGYRVDDRDDYECIDEPFIKYPVTKFEGTHGYAITTNTARAILHGIDQQWPLLPLGVSIDFYLGVQNIFKLNMTVVDPAPLVAVMEQKASETQPEGKVARYNMAPHNGFIKGLKNTDKYTYDPENNWLIF